MNVNHTMLSRDERILSVATDTVPESDHEIYYFFQIF